MTDVKRGALINGRYQARRKLGEGAFAEVWEADDLQPPATKVGPTTSSSSTSTCSTSCSQLHACLRPHPLRHKYTMYVQYAIKLEKRRDAGNLRKEHHVSGRSSST
jgi:hypothetical protein